MEQQQLIKLIEETSAQLTDRAQTFQLRAEDFAFRSQHVSNALKNGFPVRDHRHRCWHDMDQRDGRFRAGFL